MKKYALKKLKDNPSLDFLLARGRSYEAIMVKWRRRGITLLNPVSCGLDYRKDPGLDYGQNYGLNYGLDY